MTRQVALGFGLFLAACFGLGSAALAGRSSSAKPSDFQTYLREGKLPALHLVELERLCIEEGDLAACRQAADLLDEAGGYDQALNLADALASRPPDLGEAAMLIKARSLVGAAHCRRALGVLDSVVGAFPPVDEMVEAVALRSGCELGLGLTDQALLNLRILEPLVGPDQRQAYLGWRARAEEERGDRAKAADLYQEGWKNGSMEAAVGLARCHLKAGRIDAFLALLKEISKRELALPHADGFDLAARFGIVKPTVWRALMKSLIADTTFNAGTCPGMVPGIVRVAEAGEDVTPYCDVLLGHAGPISSKQQLRYARALGLKEPARSVDSLTYLLGEATDLGLRTRCLGAALALNPEGRVALIRDLGSGVRALATGLAPDERLELARTLVDCGAGDVALVELKALREGLKAGHDDLVMSEIGILAERAGDRAAALGLYDQVAGSPLQTSVSLECEKRAFLLRTPAGPESDIAKDVEKIVKKGASDLELGDLFMNKLKDYERAATYYRSAATASGDGDDADRIRLKLAQALGLANLKVPDDLRRTEALNVLASLARSKAVKPDDVIGATKVATDWLSLDKGRVIEIASGLAERKDLGPAALYNVATLWYHLFERDDPTVYERSITLLTRLGGEPSAAKQAPFAGLMLARLRLLAGDYAGALDAFAPYAEKARDPLLSSLANAGTGECYLASGGIARAVEYLKKSQAPEANFELGWCWELLGEPDSSEACYRAALARPVPAQVADRVRLRLGLLMAHRQDLETALGAIDSPLPDVRTRRRPAGPVIAADALAAAGYDVIGVAALIETGSLDSAGSAAACEALLAAARYTAEFDPVAAHALLETARPDPDYPLEDYAVVVGRARYACSSSEPGLCTEARQQLMKRFPLEKDVLTELMIRRALAAPEVAPGEAGEAPADSLLAQAPVNPLMAEVLYRKGIGRLAKGDYPGAEQVFLEVTQAYPSSRLYRDACFKLGSAYYMMEQFDSSALYFGLAALSDKPALVRDALFNYSLALEQIGEFRKAADACRELAVDFPFSEQFERSLVRAGYCLQSAGSPAEAIPFYRGVLRYGAKSETLAETRYWIAEAFAQMGDHPRAACEFLRMAYLYPKEAQWAGTAAFTAGDECEKAGLVDHAITIYRQNVRKYGKTSEWGKASEERLAELARPTPASPVREAPGGK